MDTERSPPRLIISLFELGRLWPRAKPENRAGQNAGLAEALRGAQAREEVLLRRLQSVMEEHETLRDESHHRLLNNLQMVVSLLTMQSRAATPEVAPQLAAAARRVMAIERIHRRLHVNDGTKNVAFKAYLEGFCNDISALMEPREGAGREILVECDDIYLATPVAIPLGFIIAELITNAVKHGTGGVRVRLEGRPDCSCALTIANEGAALPAGYDPAASKGLGMKIIRSFVQQIGGEFRFGPGPGEQGAQFSVLFPDVRQI